MPELEEGNLWIRGTAAAQRHAGAPGRDRQAGAGHHGRLPRGGVDRRPARPARRRHRHRRLLQQRILRAAAAAERLAAAWSSRPAGGGLFGAQRARTKEELVDDMNAELERKIPGVVWNFSQNIRDNVMEAMSGVKGDNSVKIFGPDLDKLEDLADEGQERPARHPGHRERGHLPHPRAVAPGVPRRSGEVPEVGRA